VDWLFTRGRKVVFGLIFATTAVFAAFAVRVDVESDNASLAATDGAAAAAHASFANAFGDDDDLFVAVTFEDGLTPASLDRIDELTEFIERLPGVRNVLSLSNAPVVARGRAGAEIATWFPPAERRRVEKFSVRRTLATEPVYAGLLVSYDGDSAGLIVDFDGEAAGTGVRAGAMDAIRRRASAAASIGMRIRVVGVAAEKYEVARLVRRDQAVLVPAAIVVLALVLFYFGRTAASALVPLAVTGISLCWTIGALVAAGFRLNAITSLLPPVVMVLSVATSVHLYYGWAQGGAGEGPEQRARAALERLWKPCALTSLTTAFGLAALCSSDTPAVRQFGAFAAFGVIASFVVAISLVPLWLSVSTVRPAAKIRTVLETSLVGLSDFAAAFAVPVAVVGGVLLCGAAYGVTEVRSNTDLVRFLQPGSELRSDSEFVDERFAGTMSLELTVSSADGRPLIRPDDVSRLREFSERVSGRPEFRRVTTILDVLEPLGRAENDSQALPDDPMELAYLFDLFAESADAEAMRRFSVPDFSKLRVTLRGPSLGSARAAEVVARVEADAAEIFGKGYEVAPTGTYYRLAQESDRIVSDQVRSFGLAFLLVGVAIAAVFRSWRLVVASLMGILGIDLSTGTAMVACVVIGIAVDDTIHYLSRYRRAYRGDAWEAVREANAGAGVAMTVTSVVLVLGFWVGAAGSFKPTVYFSLLSGSTMMIALLCDLIVLPACLVLAYGRASERDTA
jgi:predicted RND superfamily exporter protein